MSGSLSEEIGKMVPPKMPEVPKMYCGCHGEEEVFRVGDMSPDKPIENRAVSSIVNDC